MQYTFDVHAIVRDRKAILLDATYGGTPFQRRVSAGKWLDASGAFDKMKAAEWLIAQIPYLDAMETMLVDHSQSLWRGRLIITAHTEQRPDPETGVEHEVTIVDGVQTQKLTEDSAEDAIRAMPGWATWSADEATQWIDANVNDLASAKTALKAMAKLLVYLRERSLA